MIVKTRGIVFRCIKYGETSIITDIYTEELGLRSYLVNGVRKAKSRMSATFFQIGSLLELVVYDKDHKSLNRIKEVSTSYLYQHLPFSVIKSAMAQFILEITRKSIKEKEKNTKLFHFLYDSFSKLDALPRTATNFHIDYILALPVHLGFTLEPTLMEPPYYLDIREGIFTKRYDDPGYQLTDQQSLWTNQLLSDVPININSSQRKHLIDGILLYYKYHVPNFGSVNAHDILSEILH